MTTATLASTRSASQAGSASADISTTKDATRQVHEARTGTQLQRIRLASNPYLCEEAEEILRASGNRLVGRALDTMRAKRDRKYLRGIPQPFTSHLPPGNYWNADLGRCERCDSAYCHSGCFAGDPNRIYVTGRGWVTRTEAQRVADIWRALGHEFGPHHPIRRIEVLCAGECCRTLFPLH